MLCGPIGINRDIYRLRKQIQSLGAHILTVIGNKITVGFHLKGIHQGMERALLFKNRRPIAINVLIGIDRNNAVNTGSLGNGIGRLGSIKGNVISVFVEYALNTASKR